MKKRRGQKTYMVRPLGTVDGKGHAVELDGGGCAVRGGDMVRLLEELLAVGVGVGLDGPAVGGVGEGLVGVVDGEVHKLFVSCSESGRAVAAERRA